MWRHLLPLKDFRYTSISLIITWPYHRTLRYFTLDPAARLTRDLDANNFDLGLAVQDWRAIKANELDFVCAASTISAAANIGIFSWTNINNDYWLATAMFYFSLSLSLWGVANAAQQRSVVRALQVPQFDPHKLRRAAQIILRRRPGCNTGAGRHRSFAELNMLYVWQCPLMLMSYGWMTLLLGLTLHVCAPLISYQGQDDVKVAIFYLSTGFFLFLNFIWASAWVCWTPGGEHDIEKGHLSECSPTSTVPTGTWSTFGRKVTDDRMSLDAVRSQSCQY